MKQDERQQALRKLGSFAFADMMMILFAISAHTLLNDKEMWVRVFGLAVIIMAFAYATGGSFLKVWIIRRMKNDLNSGSNE